MNDGTKYVIWQFSEKGRVPGIVGNVDLNRFGPGYSEKDIRINSQHIISSTGLDISPEDLVINSSQAKIKEMPKVDVEMTPEKQKELQKLKAQYAKEEARMQKQREKVAAQKSKELSEARRKEARENAKRGITVTNPKGNVKAKKDDDENALEQGVDKVKDGVGSFFKSLASFFTGDEEAETTAKQETEATAKDEVEPAKQQPVAEKAALPELPQATPKDTLKVNERKIVAPQEGSKGVRLPVRKRDDK
jgi:hypothetical protein